MPLYLDFAKVPTDLIVEPIKIGEQYPRLVLKIGLTISNSDFVILESDTKIILEKQKGGGRLEVNCAPYEIHHQRSDRSMRFYTFLTSDLYQSIETFRSGENIKVNLNIRRLCILNYENLGSLRPIQDKYTASARKGQIDQIFYLVSHEVDGNTQNHLLITRDEWAEKVLKPFGISSVFILEMPCKLPDTTSTDAKAPEIEDLKDRINRGITIIKKAKSEYDSTKNAENAVADVRKAIELLYQIPNKGDGLYETFARYLIEETNTGSNNIAKEQIKDVFEICKSLFNISSKTHHTTSHTTKMQIEYYPKYEDADMLLGEAAFIFYFLAKKLERRLTGGIIL